MSSEGRCEWQVPGVGRQGENATEAQPQAVRSGPRWASPLRALVCGTPGAADIGRAESQVMGHLVDVAALPVGSASH